MKILSFFSFLMFLTLAGYSQPDPDDYYAASRLDYYTTEETAEVFVYIPPRLKGSENAVDLVFEYQVLNKEYPVTSSGVTTVPFSTKLLKVGKNEITVSFYVDEKWVDSRKVWITILPDKDNTVKIDRAGGGLFIGGLPFIPAGFSSLFPVPKGMPENSVVKGFNLISPDQEITKKTLKERKSYMNRCADLGMMVNYNISSLISGAGMEAGGKPGMTVNESLELVRKEVELFRDHPALLAWTIAEEPDSRDLHADSLLPVYNLIKELDPYHPVALLIGSPRIAMQYQGVTDIIMTNPSPIPQGSIDEINDFLRIIENAFWLQKPVWLVGQAYGGTYWYQREPTPLEVRAMTYMAVIGGVTGIQYKPGGGPDGLPKSTAMWDECAALSLEIAEISPDIASPQYAPRIKSNLAYIHGKAWNRTGLVTIVVVNAQNRPAQYELTMEDIDITVEATVMFENRKVPVVDGVIKDMIGGYGTHVYRLDLRRMVDFNKGFRRDNLAKDGGFEDVSNAGVPSTCVVSGGSDLGNTFFVDSRSSFQGEHSLRLNNPADKAGDMLSFCGLELSRKKSYTVSVMAKSGYSSNIPGGKNGGPVRFILGLGPTSQTFSCTDEWRKYQVNGIRFHSKSPGNEWISPVLLLAGKGTAWFDVLQVYPDIEIIEGRGEAGYGSVIELKPADPEAQLFYTIDGTEPTAQSSLYIGAVAIDNSMTFKAAAFKNGKCVGYVER